MVKDLEIRGTWKQVLLGKLAAGVVGLLSLTLRYRVEDPYGVKASLEPEKPAVWVFWHGCLLVAPVAAGRFLKQYRATTLASASRDGAIIESFLSCYGVKSVRGSSSRRAVAALIALKRSLKEGDHVFITPDGPRGPRYQVKGGAVKLAQSAQVPLIPVRFFYSSSWKIKSWDRLRIPKPFSVVTMHVTKPTMIPSKLDENDFESYRENVESVLSEGIDDFPNLEKL